MTKIAFTIPEACEFSGLGRSSLYRLFEQGVLTPRKAGRRTLILREELEAYIRGLPTATAAEGRRDPAERDGATRLFRRTHAETPRPFLRIMSHQVV